MKAKFRAGQVTLEEFIAARAKTKRPQFLTMYSAEELRDFRLYLTEDGVGFALKPGGELLNVFINSPRRGAGAEAVLLAIAEGATKLDCFANYLDKWYSKLGFEGVGRDK